MTSSNGNFSALLTICAENSPVPGEFPAQMPVTLRFGFSLICVWINGWVNNRETGDLRCHRAHYDVIVMGKIDWYRTNVKRNKAQSVCIIPGMYCMIALTGFIFIVWLHPLRSINKLFFGTNHSAHTYCFLSIAVWLIYNQWPARPQSGEVRPPDCFGTTLTATR